MTAHAEVRSLALDDLPLNISRSRGEPEPLGHRQTLLVMRQQVLRLGQPLLG